MCKIPIKTCVDFGMTREKTSVFCNLLSVFLLASNIPLLSYLRSPFLVTVCRQNQMDTNRFFLRGELSS